MAVVRAGMAGRVVDVRGRNVSRKHVWLGDV